MSIDANMQFDFTDAIFIMRQVQEKHQAKKTEMYYVFVDLEKAFDRIQREVVIWALRKWCMHSYGIVYRGFHCC